MSNTLTIEVWDATGNKQQLVEVPADAPVNRVIAVLVERMNLPRQSPDGQLMCYKFHHRATWHTHRVGWVLALAVLLQVPYRLLGLRSKEGAPLGRLAPRLFGYFLI